MDATRIAHLAMTAAGIIATAGCVERVPLHTADTNLTAGSGYVTFFVLPGIHPATTMLTRNSRPPS